MDDTCRHKDRPRWRAHACVDRRQSSRWIGGRSSWGRGPVDHRGGSAHQWANGTARCFKWPKRPCSPLAVHRVRGPHGTVTNKTARAPPGKETFRAQFLGPKACPFSAALATSSFADVSDAPSSLYWPVQGSGSVPGGADSTCSPLQNVRFAPPSPLIAPHN